MRKSFLLAGVLMASVLALRCDGKPTDDDDDDAGQSGESGEGGKGGGAGKGAAAGGKGGAGGSAGSSASTGGMSGSSPGSGGDPATGGTGSGASPATGGSGGSGGTGNAGDTGMAGEPGAGGTTGGSDGTGGTTGGTDSSGGTGGTGGGAGMGGGGSSGKGGAAGSGGSAGKAGAGGSGGKSCGAGDGLELTSEPGTAGVTGWIEGDDNCVGIQGAVQVSADLAGSAITLAETDGRICVSGFAARVVSSNFDDYWGAFVSIQLNNPGTGAALAYDATSYGVDGFSFSIIGEAVPPEIRPTLIVSSSTVSQYCKRICAGGDQSMLLSQAHLDCWDGTAGALPSATTLTTLRFAIPSVTTGDTPFDFCIEDLAAITDNVSIGSPGECPEAPVDPLTTCVDRCGTFDTYAECQCDLGCGEGGDCCADYVAECIGEG